MFVSRRQRRGSERSCETWGTPVTSRDVLWPTGRSFVKPSREIWRTLRTPSYKSTRLGQTVFFIRGGKDYESSSGFNKSVAQNQQKKFSLLQINGKTFMNCYGNNHNLFLMSSCQNTILTARLWQDLQSLRKLFVRRPNHTRYSRPMFFFFSTDAKFVLFPSCWNSTLQIINLSWHTSPVCCKTGSLVSLRHGERGLGWISNALIWLSCCFSRP